ncbi:MAG TPA: HD domain-containing protein [Polyangiaceae bacterium]|nr:HD domain-containing protein [Polyangiaceae bacterium]
MILRDPVHGLIPFDTPEDQIIVRLLEAPEVQRLRRIRQLGVASFAFPGAEHTRFAHALGSAHVMRRLVARLRDVQGDIAPAHRLDKRRAREALAAALLHDVGHGPLSHSFEEALPNAPRHETWSTRVILDRDTGVGKVLADEDPELPAVVAELVRGHHELAYLARAVSGTFDVDRCDYLLRDAHATGVPYGRYDLDWLLRALTFAQTSGGEAPPLAIDGAKGIVSLESFVLARLFMHQQVYFHKAARAAEWMLCGILRRATALLRDGSKLPGALPALASIAYHGDAPLGEYLELDDGALFVAMHAWESSSDSTLADLCRRIRGRSLFKTLELYGTSEATRAAALATAREIAKKRGLAPDAYVGLDVASDTPFSDDDDPLTVLFPHRVAKKPGDVSFLLGRLRDETVTRVRLIFAPELREAITAAIPA